MSPNPAVLTWPRATPSTPPVGEGFTTDGLLLYLNGEDFTNAPPTTTWQDRSTADHDGTPAGFAYTTTSGSDGAGNVVFDGINDRVSCGTSYTITNGLTVCAWVRAASTAIYGRIVGREGDWGLVFYPTAPTQLRWLGSGLDTNFPTAAPNLVDTWRFVAATYDGSGIDGYVDGASVGTISKTGNLTTSAAVPVVVGNRAAADRAFKGSIGAALVYNRALSTAELAEVQTALARPLP